jgi:hypothetical protein
VTLLVRVVVQKMRDDGKDSYDIKKQEEVLQESYMMIPDSKNRLEKAFDSLNDVVVSNVHLGFMCLWNDSDVFTVIEVLLLSSFISCRFVRSLLV